MTPSTTTRPSLATRLRGALHDPHTRQHGRGRILDALCVCVVVAQAEGHSVAFGQAGTGNQSWQMWIDGRTYYVRIRAGRGAPMENGVVYLLDAARNANVLAEWRNRADVVEWFDALPPLTAVGQLVAYTDNLNDPDPTYAVISNPTTTQGAPA